MKQKIRELNLILLALKTVEERKAYLESLGEEFETLKNPVEVFIDTRDYTLYSIVKIGNHYWLGENMRYDCGEGCYANETSAKHLNTYGRLYSYEAAQKSCPEGFVIPDFKAWAELLEIAGGYFDVLRDCNVGADIETGKSTLSKDGATGFDCEFAGIYEYSKFVDFEKVCYFWTSFQPAREDEIYTVSIDNESDYAVVNLCGTKDVYSCRYILATDLKYKLKALNDELLALPTVDERKACLENGNEEIKKQIESGDVFLDKRDYTLYSIIKFGNQSWLGENLRYKAGYDCYLPDGKPENLLDLGMLYTEESAMNACPEGFHIPSRDEWFQLFEYLGATCSEYEIEHDKDVFLQLTDGGQSGFDLRKAGVFDQNKNEYKMESSAYYLAASNQYFFFEFAYIGRDKFYNNENKAISCRCIKDK